MRRAEVGVGTGGEWNDSMPDVSWQPTQKNN
jgi:hypothetical protein